VRRILTVAMLALLNMAALYLGIVLLLHDPLLRGMQVYSALCHLVENNYVEPIDRKLLLYGSLDRIRAHLDPFTGYLPPRK